MEMVKIGRNNLWIIGLLIGCMACTGLKSEKAMKQIDAQGHRGCRGLLPENSVPAFLHAIDLGVTTLEMDVVISRDQQVVVSHEPFLSHEICVGPNGEEITEETERSWNLYEMDYAQIKNCDCGSKAHTRFPDQTKQNTYKPLLSEVIDAAESKVLAEGKPAVYYNIETKSQPQSDEIFHPDPETFTDLLVQVIRDKKIESRTIIQSFDVRTLQVAHHKYPEIPLALLIENEDSPEKNIEKLGFVPEIYSPYFVLVDEALMKFAQEKSMKVIPWTLNEKEDMKRMLDLSVDGIISDYPDRLMEVLQTEKSE